MRKLFPQRFKKPKYKTTENLPDLLRKINKNELMYYEYIENIINNTPISIAVFNSCKILYIPLLFSLNKLFTMLISLCEGTV